MRRIQGKKHKMGNTKSTKYHYLFLMTKDLFSIMIFIPLLIFIKTQKITDKKDSHKKKRFSKMITNKNKCVQINSR